MNNVNEILKNKLSADNYDKLMALDNSKLHEFVAKYVELCNPDKVFVRTDSADFNTATYNHATSLAWSIV